MRKPSFTDRLRYAFDNIVAKGPVMIIGWISFFALATIFLVSLGVTLSGIDPGVSLLEQFWIYLMLTLEPDAPDNHIWAFRFVTLGVVLLGILLVSTLIGATTASIEGRLEQLRKGRSKVLEHDHTVILGWSEQIFTIIAELVIANQFQHHTHIVILGDKDKVEMEDEIWAKVGRTGSTHVICRHGNPIEVIDLELVSLHTAKSIIILASEEEDPDSVAIKTLLAIINDPHRRPEPYHIVMYLHEAKNAQVAKIVGQDEVEVVVTTDFIARITAQASRQSGLSTVYMELLDFKGDDIYFHQEPALEGKSYGDALLAYNQCALIGIHPRQGKPLLNPPATILIQKGDAIIVIAENKPSIRLSSSIKWRMDERVIQSCEPRQPKPEHTLILGWNRSVPQIINELDSYVAPGSTVTVVANSTFAESILKQRCKSLERQQFTFQSGDTTDRELLEALPLEAVDHAILVAYSDELDIQHADARTLVTLLHMRDLVRQRQLPMSIVSEMLDIRNRNLVTVTQADDFVVSEQLVSFYLAQVAENKALHTVFSELFDAEGMEIYLKPAGAYVKPGVPVNFYTVIVAARNRQETAVGYRCHADAQNAEKAYGVVLNPPKNEAITFAAADRIIVIALE
ncbi:MAG: NAD-binding protein [Caldilineaceae bacterium]